MADAPLTGADPRSGRVGVPAQVAPGLTAVGHQPPAAVLLVDLVARAVVYANPVAVQLAPGVALPAALDAWSDAAELRDVDGAELSETSHPLSLVARSQPVAGQAVSAARATEMGRRREPLWVVALPLDDAPRLEDHALVVLLPLSERESAPAAATAASATAELRDRAVLATGMSFTVVDARADDRPLIWVNPAFTATTGYAYGESVGRNCRFLQGPGTDPAAVAEMREALAAGRAVTVTVLNHRRDGTAFWNEVALSPIHGPDGALTHYVGIQTDVTGRVVADRERDAALAAERAARLEAESARAEAEVARRRVALLAEATGLLASTLDVTASLQRLADLVVPLLGDWAVIATSDGSGHVGQVLTRHRDGREEEMRRCAGVLGEERGRRVLLGPLLADGRARRVAARDARQGAGWAADGDQRLLDLAAGLGTDALLVVPLTGRDHLDGLLVLGRDAGGPQHSDDDLAVARDLGRRAGLVLDNARLYQNEHRIAEALQRSLLPALPALPGVTAAARYRTGDSAASVGGDFYELMGLPDGAVGLAIGDVVGHDVLAAAAMGHLRGLLRACAMDVDPYPPDQDRRSRRTEDPARVLDQVDRLLAGLGIATMATAAYARLTPGPGGGWDLAHASAGHPPLLVRGPGGGVEVLVEGDNLLLGVAETTRTSARRHLEAGSTVLAYTDGLVERRGEHLQVGIDRLAAAFAAAPCDVEALTGHLVDTLGDSDDDVAVLAVHLP